MSGKFCRFAPLRSAHMLCFCPIIFKRRQQSVHCSRKQRFFALYRLLQFVHLHVTNAVQQFLTISEMTKSSVQTSNSDILSSFGQAAHVSLSSYCELCIKQVKTGNHSAATVTCTAAIITSSPASTKLHGTKH